MRRDDRSGSCRSLSPPLRSGVIIARQGERRKESLFSCILPVQKPDALYFTPLLWSVLWLATLSSGSGSRQVVVGEWDYGF
jgi:hypothetical protein